MEISAPFRGRECVKYGRAPQQRCVEHGYLYSSSFTYSYAERVETPRERIQRSIQAVEVRMRDTETNLCLLWIRHLNAFVIHTHSLLRGGRFHSLYRISLNISKKCVPDALILLQSSIILRS